MNLWFEFVCCKYIEKIVILLFEKLHPSFCPRGGGRTGQGDLSLSLYCPLDPPYFQPIFLSPVHIRGSNGAITRAA